MAIRNFQKVEVSAYSGFRHFEKPLEIIFMDKKMAIKRIIERSIEEISPSGERIYRFLVSCENNKTFNLIYNLKEDQWFIST